MADTPLTPATQTTSSLPRTALRRELGYSGTLKPGGFIVGEEYNRNLIGRQALNNYDIMSRSDATVHAALQVCKLPIMAAHWRFKSPSDDPGDIERTDLLNREFFDRKIDFYDVMGEGLTCLDFGYSLLEIVYELTTFNGQQRWGLAKLASRKQNSVLRWQTSTGTPGITQIILAADVDKAPNVDIPMQKLCIFTNEKRGENYEGISLLRFAYKHWYLKDKLELMNAVALERMGLGVPYVKTGISGQNSDDNAIAAVEAALRQIRVNEEAYLKYPASLEVGMLNMNANGTKDILPTLEYEDMQILLSVLAQFLGLGMNGKSGSRALSSDHSQLFLRSLEAVARIMTRGFQSIANRLIDLNYDPNKLPNGYPKLTVEDLDDEDVATISTALSSLVQYGVITPGIEVENRARSLLDIKQLTQEDWDTKQQEQQEQDQQKAEQAKQLAEQQAKAQQGNPAQPDPNQEPKPAVKAKQKADALAAARIAQRNLLGALAEG